MQLQLTVDPDVFYSSSFSVATMLKSYLHSVYTIIIVKRMLIENILHNCRKNSILTGSSEIPLESVITGFAHIQDVTHYAHTPSVTVLFNELKAFMCFYFFRLCAKKPRVSSRISLARLVSRSSASSSFMHRSFSLSGIALLPLPTKTSSPRASR